MKGFESSNHYRDPNLPDFDVIELLSNFSSKPSETHQTLKFANGSAANVPELELFFVGVDQPQKNIGSADKQSTKDADGKQQAQLKLPSYESWQNIWKREFQQTWDLKSISEQIQDGKTRLILEKIDNYFKGKDPTALESLRELACHKISKAPYGDNTALPECVNQFYCQLRFVDAVQRYETANAAGDKQKAFDALVDLVVINRGSTTIANIKDKAEHYTTDRLKDGSLSTADMVWAREQARSRALEGNRNFEALEADFLKRPTPSSVSDAFRREGALNRLEEFAAKHFSLGCDDQKLAAAQNYRALHELQLLQECTSDRAFAVHLRNLVDLAHAGNPFLNTLLKNANVFGSIESNQIIEKLIRDLDSNDPKKAEEARTQLKSWLPDDTAIDAEVDKVRSRSIIGNLCGPEIPAYGAIEQAESALKSECTQGNKSAEKWLDWVQVKGQLQNFAFISFVDAEKRPDAGRTMILNLSDMAAKGNECARQSMIALLGSWQSAGSEIDANGRPALLPDLTNVTKSEAKVLQKQALNELSGLVRLNPDLTIDECRALTISFARAMSANDVTAANQIKSILDFAGAHSSLRRSNAYSAIAQCLAERPPIEGRKHVIDSYVNLMDQEVTAYETAYKPALGGRRQPVEGSVSVRQLVDVPDDPDHNYILAGMLSRSMVGPGVDELQRVHANPQQRLELIKALIERNHLSGDRGQLLSTLGNLIGTAEKAPPVELVQKARNELRRAFDDCILPDGGVDPDKVTTYRSAVSGMMHICQHWQKEDADRVLRHVTEEIATGLSQCKSVPPDVQQDLINRLKQRFQPGKMSEDERLPAIQAIGDLTPFLKPKDLSDLVKLANEARQSASSLDRSQIDLALFSSLRTAYYETKQAAVKDEVIRQLLEPQMRFPAYMGAANLLTEYASSNDANPRIKERIAELGYEHRNKPTLGDVLTAMGVTNPSKPDLDAWVKAAGSEKNLIAIVSNAQCFNALPKEAQAMLLKGHDTARSATLNEHASADRPDVPLPKLLDSLKRNDSSCYDQFRPETFDKRLATLQTDILTQLSGQSAGVANPGLVHANLRASRFQLMPDQFPRAQGTVQAHPAQSNHTQLHESFYPSSVQEFFLKTTDSTRATILQKVDEVMEQGKFAENYRAAVLKNVESMTAQAAARQGFAHGAAAQVDCGAVLKSIEEMKQKGYKFELDRAVALEALQSATAHGRKSELFSWRMLAGTQVHPYIGYAIARDHTVSEFEAKQAKLIETLSDADKAGAAKAADRRQLEAVVQVIDIAQQARPYFQLLADGKRREADENLIAMAREHGSQTLKIYAPWAYNALTAGSDGGGALGRSYRFGLCNSPLLPASDYLPGTNFGFKQALYTLSGDLSPRQIPSRPDGMPSEIELGIRENTERNKAFATNVHDIIIRDAVQMLDYDPTIAKITNAARLFNRDYQTLKALVDSGIEGERRAEFVAEITRTVKRLGETVESIQKSLPELNEIRQDLKAAFNAASDPSAKAALGQRWASLDKIFDGFAKGTKPMNDFEKLLRLATSGSLSETTALKEFREDILPAILNIAVSALACVAIITTCGAGTPLAITAMAASFAGFGLVVNESYKEAVRFSGGSGSDGGSQIGNAFRRMATENGLGKFDFYNKATKRFEDGPTLSKVFENYAITAAMDFATTVAIMGWSAFVGEILNYGNKGLDLSKLARFLSSMNNAPEEAQCLRLVNGIYNNIRIMNAATTMLSQEELSLMQMHINECRNLTFFSVGCHGVQKTIEEVGDVHGAWTHIVAALAVATLHGTGSHYGRTFFSARPKLSPRSNSVIMPTEDISAFKTALDASLKSAGPDAPPLKMTNVADGIEIELSNGSKVTILPSPKANEDALNHSAGQFSINGTGDKPIGKPVSENNPADSQQNSSRHNHQTETSTTGDAAILPDNSTATASSGKEPAQKSPLLVESMEQLLQQRRQLSDQQKAIFSELAKMENAGAARDQPAFEKLLHSLVDVESHLETLKIKMFFTLQAELSPLRQTISPQLRVLENHILETTRKYNDERLTSNNKLDSAQRALRREASQGTISSAKCQSRLEQLTRQYQQDKTTMDEQYKISSRKLRDTLARGKAIVDSGPFRDQVASDPNTKLDLDLLDKTIDSARPKYIAVQNKLGLFPDGTYFLKASCADVPVVVKGPGPIPEHQALAVLKEVYHRLDTEAKGTKPSVVPSVIEFLSDPTLTYEGVANQVRFGSIKINFCDGSERVLTYDHELGHLFEHQVIKANPQLNQVVWDAYRADLQSAFRDGTLVTPEMLKKLSATDHFAPGKAVEQLQLYLMSRSEIIAEACKLHWVQEDCRTRGEQPPDYKTLVDKFINPMRQPAMRFFENTFETLKREAFEPQTAGSKPAAPRSAPSNAADATGKPLDGTNNVARLSIDPKVQDQGPRLHSTQSDRTVQEQLNLAPKEVQPGLKKLLDLALQQREKGKLDLASDLENLAGNLLELQRQGKLTKEMEFYLSKEGAKLLDRQQIRDLKGRVAKQTTEAPKAADATAKPERKPLSTQELTEKTDDAFDKAHTEIETYQQTDMVEAAKKYTVDILSEYFPGVEPVEVMAGSEQLTIRCSDDSVLKFKRDAAEWDSNWGHRDLDVPFLPIGEGEARPMLIGPENNPWVVYRQPACKVPTDTQVKKFLQQVKLKAGDTQDFGRDIDVARRNIGVYTDPGTGNRKVGTFDYKAITYEVGDHEPLDVLHLSPKK